jgi:hypothetical protein
VGVEGIATVHLFLVASLLCGSELQWRCEALRSGGVYRGHRGTIYNPH